jgi:hypothetical protein
VTSCPSHVSSYALPSPTIPPPTTTIFIALVPFLPSFPALTSQ